MTTLTEQLAEIRKRYSIAEMSETAPKTAKELQYQSIAAFCDEVNRRAEANMLKTSKLEGSHYAAMSEIRKELGL